MSWKETMQVRDLAPDQRLEMTCRVCGHVHYLTPALIKASQRRDTLYLDEIEKMTSCKSRGCAGAVRMALVKNRPTSSFVGGLA